MEAALQNLELPNRQALLGETATAPINIQLVRIGLVRLTDWVHGTMDHLAPAPMYHIAHYSSRL